MASNIVRRTYAAQFAALRSDRTARVRGRAGRTAFIGWRQAKSANLAGGSVQYPVKRGHRDVHESASPHPHKTFRKFPFLFANL